MYITFLSTYRLRKVRKVKSAEKVTVNTKRFVRELKKSKARVYKFNKVHNIDFEKTT